jgi:hypothetical protein
LDLIGNRLLTKLGKRLLIIVMNRKTFLNEVEAFLLATEITPTRFGIEAVKDPSFVRELRHGRSVTLKLLERVQEYMAAKAR